MIIAIRFNSLDPFDKRPRLVRPCLGPKRHVAAAKANINLILKEAALLGGRPEDEGCCESYAVKT
jgi:hypothetical protein